MRYVASYLLAALGGNASPSAKDIKKILDSVGIEADDSRLNKVIRELNGKNIGDVIAQGIGKLASVPAGGGAVAVSAAPGSAPAAAEEKKDERKEESEESDDDKGFGLFDHPCLLPMNPAQNADDRGDRRAVFSRSAPAVHRLSQEPGPARPRAPLCPSREPRPRGAWGADAGAAVHGPAGRRSSRGTRTRHAEAPRPLQRLRARPATACRTRTAPR
ncbi:LOW QUALITY PROTEIN: uncharacterized protein LOC142437370 [Tenrec ecaudatus]|uniref:LOW QUALITY PROTEIN: uncharacterized protein LOC142437370 n=1 Tax=Tenrec ecaudatus TaxID=94439 RepID=UPI003F5A4153